MTFQKIMESKCSKCGGLNIFKQGVKKETGKPWSGYFCQNPQCKNVDWTPKTPVKPQNSPSVASEPQGREIVLLERLERMEGKIDLLLREKVKEGSIDVGELEF